MYQIIWLPSVWIRPIEDPSLFVNLIVYTCNVVEGLRSSMSSGGRYVFLNGRCTNCKAAQRMNPEDQFIPRFPSELLPENQTAFDVSSTGVVACATGSTLHFGYLKGSQLVRAFSSQIGKNPITTLKFDNFKKQLAIGTSRGSVYLFDIETKSPISAGTFSKEPSPILSLIWRHSILLVLRANRKLTALSYSAAVCKDKSSPFQHQHFSLIWEITLPADHTRMTLHPDTLDMLLLSSDGPHFSIYKFVSASDPPVPFMHLVTLNGGGQIKDAQWSLSMREQALILLSGEVFMFNTVSQGISSVVQQPRVASPFDRLIQFPSDSSQILILHKSGTISVMNSRNPCNIVLQKEVVHKQKHQNLVNWCQAPLDDKRIALWYGPSGIGVYDVEKDKIVSFMTLFTSRITSFATDGVSVAICTQDGCVICSDLFDADRTQLFRVSDEPVLFASVCAARNRVYWHTRKTLGAIELATRSVRHFGGKTLPILKATGSFEGALLVQRAPQVLGLYVNDRESPVLIEKDVLDFCFNDANAGVDEGRFAVLLDTREIWLYQYNSKKVRVFKRLSAFCGSMNPISIAWQDDTILYGTLEGSVNTLTLSSRKVNQLCRHQNWKPSVLSYHDSKLFGISSDGHLFVGSEETKIQVLKYYPVSPHLLLVLRPNGILELLTLPDFTPLLTLSTMFPLQSREELIRSKLLESTPEKYLTPDGRDAWLCLRKEPPLRMTALCGVGDAQRFTNYEIALAKDSTLPRDLITKLVFSLLVFSNRFAEGAELLLNSNLPESKMEQDRIYSLFLANVSLRLSNTITDEQQAQLKAAAIRLFEAKRFDDAVILLKLGNMEKTALDYLLELNQISLAIRLIQSIEDETAKREAMMRCGVHLLQRGNLKRSIPFFAAAKQFHPLLFVMYTLGEIVDCYLLKNYAKANGILTPIDPVFMKQCTNMLGLDELSSMVDAEFQSILSDINLDITQVL